jgi:hypothetical protein
MANLGVAWTARGDPIIVGEAGEHSVAAIHAIGEGFETSSDAHVGVGLRTDTRSVLEAHSISMIRLLQV